MLEAKKVSIWKNSYGLSADGRPITTWEPSLWRSGGQYQLEGHRYEVRGNAWGTKYSLTRDDAGPIAVASGVGRKRWTIESQGLVYHFRRRSMWRTAEELQVNGATTGSIRRVSQWRGDAAADLPGLPLHLQVFALSVVLSKWDAAAAAGT